MSISYEQFIDTLNSRVKGGTDFYKQLLETVIDNPSRYSGLFRLSNAKTKLIQNVTQSNEIKFGDFMEEIVTNYISNLGYINETKDLGSDTNGDRLNADQVFTKDGVLYLVEQKIRDDHDSTKKRGQFSNFVKKCELIRQQYPNFELNASMWFIDDSLKKNKNFYRAEMAHYQLPRTRLNLYYGEEFFNSLNGGREAWQEILSHLTRMRIENSDEVVYIPDFDTSDEIFAALKEISDSRLRKLLSDNEKYVQLRTELFITGHNINRIKLYKRIR